MAGTLINNGDKTHDHETHIRPFGHRCSCCHFVHLAMAADVTVAYITNGNTNEGWTLINGGAKKAGQVKGVKFIELAAEKGDCPSNWPSLKT